VVGCLGKDARSEQRTRGERVVRETHVVWSVRGNEDVGTEWLRKTRHSNGAFIHTPSDTAGLGASLTPVMMLCRRH
jgi:hypothetical protein